MTSREFTHRACESVFFVQQRSVADRCGMRHLGGGNLDVSQSGSNRLEEIVQVIAERLRTDGNCQSYKDNQHGVLGSGGTAIVITKATGQTEHLNFLL
jgi:hypothetical protein